MLLFWYKSCASDLTYTFTKHRGLTSSHLLTYPAIKYDALPQLKPITTPLPPPPSQTRMDYRLSMLSSSKKTPSPHPKTFQFTPSVLILYGSYISLCKHGNTYYSRPESCIRVFVQPKPSIYQR